MIVSASRVLLLVSPPSPNTLQEGCQVARSTVLKFVLSNCPPRPSHRSRGSLVAVTSLLALANIARSNVFPFSSLLPSHSLPPKKMFVPKTAATSRNPRRRHRTSSDDSVKPPKAKRQRSVLRQAGDSQPASLNHEQREVAEPSISALPSDHEVATTPIGAESHLPIRSAKQPEGPSHGAEGTVVLVRIS